MTKLAQDEREVLDTDDKTKILNTSQERTSENKLSFGFGIRI